MTAASLSSAQPPQASFGHGAESTGIGKLSDSSRGEVLQTTIFDAIEAGRAGIDQSLDAAHRRNPEFGARAEAEILRHLGNCENFQCPGEDLVDICQALGIVPHDARAFGGVFQSMSRRGLIRTVGFCERRKGHGTAGGRVWALCQ